MQVLHVVAGLPPGGGIAESVPSLCQHLGRMGHDVTLATLDGPMSGAALLAEKDGVRLVRFAPSWPGRLFFSKALLHGLKQLLTAADVVHVHSNWTFPVWWACHLARAVGKPLVMSPRGCLEPVRLRHSAWKKRLAGILDRHFLRHADVLHATCDAEAEGISAYVGAPSQGRIKVIPNGVNLDVFARFIQGAGKSEGRRKRTVLYLGRLHPLKGLDLLVEAWKLVAADYPDWHLLVFGPDEQGTRDGLRRQAEKLALDGRLIFCGSVYDAEKVQAMAAADLFVLPTRNENFGIVVAEALASGLPVITTKGAPWKELLGGWESGKGDAVNSEPLTVNGEPCAANGRCGWWVDMGVEPLVDALREAMSLTDKERHAMGENGRRLVAEKYTWPRVAQQMEDVYRQAMKDRH